MFLHLPIPDEFSSLAFQKTLKRFTECHREQMLFDYDDESFFVWLAADQKHGSALNRYKDSQEILRWAEFSVFKAMEIALWRNPDWVRAWDYENDFEKQICYYVDNALFRCYACLERFFAFADIWFTLGLSRPNGKLFQPERMFTTCTSTNTEWSRSEVRLVLENIASNPSYVGLCMTAISRDENEIP